MSDPRAKPNSRVEQVAVVIATRDRAEALGALLDVLPGALTSADEVLVVDSASTTDATQRVAASAGFDVLRVDLPGTSRARNAGVDATSAPVVVFTDDDCRPRPGWTRAMSAAFGDADVGFATGRVEAEDATSFGTAAVTGADRAEFSWPDDPIDFGAGANMAVRREAFVSVRGFDEALGPGARFIAAEDHDLFFRVLRAQWRGVYVPDAVVGHDDERGRWATVRRHFDYGRGTGALVAKAWRLDRALGREMAARRCFERGVLDAARDLRRGWEVSAAGRLSAAAGTVAGAVRAAGCRLDADGHFRR